MPKQENERVVYESHVFTIKETDVTFDNGAMLKAQYMDRADGVMIFPVDADGNVVMVREYHVAIDRYTMSLVKGKMDVAGSPEEIAQKELQEEIGYKAGTLTRLASVTTYPGYSKRETHLFLAEDLSPSKLEGDEEEPLEIHRVPLEQVGEMIRTGELQESRMIASYYLAKDHLG